ncbi:hypothetical protein RBH29_07045 [Herbivorax sp. ANBcel31]|uniref:hypothetical protein n=1 Tax=Herbivorax sp. ANBcel31 TaxID=3069754 RepID=UPI0027AE4F47|nr:hypothetical protein [Herbivorax sp. ANBcel31]MDQ2086185.1 hypothetical protein [Herbivorax sp. ANBcel31]
MIFERVALIIILTLVFLRTISFGKWTWDKKNRLGAIAVYVIALATLIIPIYSMYFRY